MKTHRLHTSVAPTNFLVQEEPLAEPSTQTEMAYALRQCQMNLEFKIFHQQRALRMCTFSLAAITIRALSGVI